MKKGRNTAEILDSDDEFYDIELSEGEGQERTLVLKAAPRSRRIQLMAQGAKEIRCICCHQIKSLAGAEESEEGWFCEDCIPEMIGIGS
jgi:LSD1 subclass zinc finger protein